jgi:hypothetical protein
MPHSYEELRAAALDILAGREKGFLYEPSQYENLSLCIGQVNAQREGRIQHGNYGATYPLDMLGVAVEHTFMLLLEVLEGNATHQKTFASFLQSAPFCRNLTSSETCLIQ